MIKVCFVRETFSATELSLNISNRAVSEVKVGSLKSSER